MPEIIEKAEDALEFLESRINPELFQMELSRMIDCMNEVIEYIKDIP